MIKGKIYTVPFRRKRQGKTNYKKRLKILMSNTFRFVVRKSSRNLHASIVEFNPKGDKIIFTVSSRSLARFGWKSSTGNLPSAYLTGMLAGKKALEKGVKNAILDLGFNKTTKGSRLYAALAGAIDAGLKIPFNPEVLPAKERISGEHISQYAKLLKEDSSKFKKQFSAYGKKDLNPESIVEHFQEVKGKIHG